MTYSSNLRRSAEDVCSCHGWKKKKKNRRCDGSNRYVMFSRPPFYDDRCSRFPNYFVPYVPYPTLLVPLVGDEDVFPIFFFDDGWMDGIISCLERYPPPPPWSVSFPDSPRFPHLFQLYFVYFLDGLCWTDV